MLTVFDKVADKSFSCFSFIVWQFTSTLKAFFDFQVRVRISRPSQARRENALISRADSAFSRDFVSAHDDKAESRDFTPMRETRSKPGQVIV